MKTLEELTRELKEVLNKLWQIGAYALDAEEDCLRSKVSVQIRFQDLVKLLDGHMNETTLTVKKYALYPCRRSITINGVEFFCLLDRDQCRIAQSRAAQKEEE